MNHPNSRSRIGVPMLILLSRPSERSERRAGTQRKTSRSDNIILCRCAASLALGPGSARRCAALVRDTSAFALAEAEDLKQKAAPGVARPRLIRHLVSCASG